MKTFYARTWYNDVPHEGFHVIAKTVANARRAAVRNAYKKGLTRIELTQRLADWTWVDRGTYEDKKWRLPLAIRKRKRKTK